jgi:tetratricopeptide (TPR) repeat protein
MDFQRVITSLSETPGALLERLEAVVPHDVLRALNGANVSPLKQLRRLAQSAQFNNDKETHGWVLLRISQILLDDHKIDNALRLLTATHDAFESVRSRFGLACVLLEEARALHAVNHNALALEKAHKAILSLQKLAQPLELARAYDTLASIQARRLQRNESLVFAKKAHAIFLEFHAPNSLAWNRCLVAGLYVEMGRLSDALTLYKEALRRFESLANKNGVAWVSLQMSVIHRRRCEFDVAEALVHSAQTFYEQTNCWDRLALCWLESASIKRATADTEDALLLNRRALKIFARFRHTESMARALLQSGQVFHDRGQLSRAREQVVEAARLFRDLDHKIGSLYCDNAMAEIDVDHGDLASAEATLAQAEAAAQRWDLRYLRGWTELNSARLAMEQGRLQEAAALLDAADALALEQESRDLQSEISLARARYWLLLNDVTRLRESVESAEAFVSAFRIVRLAARAQILRGELLVMEGHADRAKIIFEETARSCKVWRQRRRRAEALLGALQVSRDARALPELLLALSYIKRDARAVEAPALQMMGHMANQLFRGEKTRTSVKKWAGSPLFLARKLLVDFFAHKAEALNAARAQLLQDGPADLHLLRPRDRQGPLPICVVS